MRARTIAILVTLTVLVGACGKQDASTPAVCLEGAPTYVEALGEAPDDVRLGGETPISDCLAENQQGGDLAAVGEAMVETATELSAEARTEPGGDAGLQLGYLIGAAQRGADRTGGIHVDLLRRLVVSARYAPGDQPLPPAFVRSYREGFDAGRDRG